MDQKFVTFQWLGRRGLLGNQFFEVAATFAYAKRHGYDLLINWEYSKYLNHNFLSYNFNAAKKIFFYEEPFFRYNSIPTIPEDGYMGIDLKGYFQSSKYFDDCIDNLRSIFTLRENYITNVNDWIQSRNINMGQTISLHVRRGDYLQHLDRFPIMPVSWYVTALDMAPDHINTVLVFSDDVKWCRDNLVGLSTRFSSILFVEGLSHQSSQQNILDMYLMGMCNCHIIANSSFSWWGSWLNPSRDKIVIAPDLDWWKAEDMRDVIEPYWILLDKHGKMRGQQ